MAFIYQNNFSGKDLVLQPNESLLYPFNLTGWNELRFGVECYLTASSGMGYSGETFWRYRNANFRTGNFFFGFINTDQSGIRSFPFESGSPFLGLGVNGNWGSSFWLGVAQPYDQKNYYQIDSFDGTGNGSASTYNSFLLVSNTDQTFLGQFDQERVLGGFLDGTGTQVSFRISNTGSGQAVFRNGVSCKILNQGSDIPPYQSGQVFFATDSTLRTPSSGGLGGFLTGMHMLPYPTQLSVTGKAIYKDRNSTSGNLLPLPNAVIINNPSSIHNLAISNLLVIKYS